jgi:FSR family fosmidomycin resistance protein-like MFS transporter
MRMGRTPRTIGLIGLAHGTSHFFHMLLPPLFPWLIGEFGSATELGLLVSVFFVISGVGQALAGFLVDRVGARPVLFFALASFRGGRLRRALAQGYDRAGAGGGTGRAGQRAVPPGGLHHPEQARIAPARWGMASRCTASAATWAGPRRRCSWRALPRPRAHGARLRLRRGCAALRAGRAGVAARAIDDRQGAWAHQAARAAAAGAAEHPMAFLKLPSVWLCFSFFFWSTCALSAIQSFASPALQQMYGLPLSAARPWWSPATCCAARPAWWWAASGGRAWSGWRRPSGDLPAGVGRAAGAGGQRLAAHGMALVVASLAGLGTGLAGPSRDMLIKRARRPAPRAACMARCTRGWTWALRWRRRCSADIDVGRDGPVPIGW